MEKKIFFTKLIERIKRNNNGKKKPMNRRIAGLAVVTALLLFTLTACVAPGPTTNSNTPGGNTGKYSEILQDVLDSTYYDSVVDRFTTYTDYNFRNLQAPILYDFLEEQGHDATSVIPS